MKASNIPLNKINPDDSEWDVSDGELWDMNNFLSCDPDMTHRNDGQMSWDAIIRSHVKATEARFKDGSTGKKVTPKSQTVSMGCNQLDCKHSLSWVMQAC